MSEETIVDQEIYLDFNGSVYWMPFANSISEASFLRLLMASSISASASCAFSPAVFLESEGGVKTTPLACANTANLEQLFVDELPVLLSAKFALFVPFPS
jgi:hypothetical protein